MQPQDLIRAAAVIIKDSGWSQGTAARDGAGGEVALFSDTVGENARSKVNPAAVSFSIYGALVKAQAGAGTSVADPGLMWDVLRRLSETEHGIPPGGTNYVHPVIGYNDDPDRTIDEVLSFLETVALTIEGGGHLPPPTREEARLDLGHA